MLDLALQLSWIVIKIVAIILPLTALLIVAGIILLRRWRSPG